MRYRGKIEVKGIVVVVYIAVVGRYKVAFKQQGKKWRRHYNHMVRWVYIYLYVYVLGLVVWMWFLVGAVWVQMRFPRIITLNYLVDT